MDVRRAATRFTCDLCLAHSGGLLFVMAGRRRLGRLGLLCLMPDELASGQRFLVSEVEVPALRIDLALALELLGGLLGGLLGLRRQTEEATPNARNAHGARHDARTAAR